MHCLWDKQKWQQKFACLGQLVWLGMLISIGTNILDIVLNLIEMDLTHILSVSNWNCGTGRNVINFGVDMSWSTKIDNIKKDI